MGKKKRGWEKETEWEKKENRKKKKDWVCVLMCTRSVGGVYFGVYFGVYVLICELI